MAKRPSLKSKIVTRSTPASVRDRKVSIFACGEVILALSLFFMVSRYLELNLWISILAVPLLLLRSDQSVALGRKRFEEYIDKSIGSLIRLPSSKLQSFKLQSLAFYSSLLVACAVLLCIVYLLELNFRTDGPWYFVQDVFFGYVATQIALAITITGWTHEVAALAQWRWPVLAVGTALTISAAIGTSLADVHGTSAALIALQPLMLTGIGVLQAPAALAEAKKRAQAEPNEELRGLVLARAARESAGTAYALFAPGFFFGGWLRTVAIRIRATFTYPLEGLLALPDNWWRTLFCIDYRYPPEVVPEYSRDDPFNLSYHLERLRSPEKLIKRYEHVVAILILFVPAYAYRLAIKSTGLAYSPLVWIAQPGNLATIPARLAEFLSDSLRERARRWFAVLAIGSVLITIPLPIARLFETPVIAPLEYIFFINIHSFRPWHWFMLISASVTILITVLLSDLRIDLNYVNESTSVARAVNRRALIIERLMRFRNISSIFLLAIVVVHASLLLGVTQSCLSPASMNRLSTFYGPAMPREPIYPIEWGLCARLAAATSWARW